MGPMRFRENIKIGREEERKSERKRKTGRLKEKWAIKSVRMRAVKDTQGVNISVAVEEDL
jgi:hypothetical protein